MITYDLLYNNNRSVVYTRVYEVQRWIIFHLSLVRFLVEELFKMNYKNSFDFANLAAYLILKCSLQWQRYKILYNIYIPKVSQKCYLPQFYGYLWLIVKVLSFWNKIALSTRWMFLNKRIWENCSCRNVKHI